MSLPPLRRVWRGHRRTVVADVPSRLQKFHFRTRKQELNSVEGSKYRMSSRSPWTPSLVG